MATIYHYNLYCDRCTKEYNKQGENIKEVRKQAKLNGWKYKKVANGSLWDLCPMCDKKIKD